MKTVMKFLRGWRMVRQFKSAGGMAKKPPLPTSARSEYMTDEMFEYLDELHSVALLNFHNAGVNLQEEFDLNKKEAIAVLGFWMKNW
jgi:hypothetical protein